MFLAVYSPRPSAELTIATTHLGLPPANQHSLPHCDPSLRPSETDLGYHMSRNLVRGEARNALRAAILQKGTRPNRDAEVGTYGKAAMGGSEAGVGRVGHSDGRCAGGVSEVPLLHKARGRLGP